MSENQVFESLAKTLSREERLDLLESIRKSISLGMSSENSVEEVELPPDERKLQMQHDFESESFWLRLWMKIVQFFTGTPETDVYLKHRLRKLLKKLQDFPSRPVSITTGYLTPSFAKEVYDLYLAILPLRNLFLFFWNDDLSLGSALRYYINRHLDKRKETIRDFLSESDLEKIYNRFPGKDKLRTELLKAVGKYIKEIPESFFSEVESAVLPLFRLRYLVLFRYQNFLSAFGLHEIPENTEESPVFTEAIYLSVAEDLQKLYYALYVAEKGMGISAGLRDLLEFYYEHLDKIRKEEDGNPLDPFEEMKEVFFHEMEEADKAIKRFKRRVPLSDILTYLKKDLYFRIVFYVPTINIKEFYTNMVKMGVLGELDALVEELKQQANDHSIVHVFGNKKRETLHYYRYYNDINYQKYQVPYFNHYRSIQLLKNLIDLFYHPVLQEPLTITSGEIILRDHLLQTKLIDCNLKMDSLQKEIIKLDNTLSPDAEAGKSFSKLRYGLGTGTANRQLFRELTKRIDQQALEIVGTGMKRIDRLMDVLGSLLETSNSSIKLQLSGVYPAIDRKRPLSEFFQESLDRLLIFQKILRETLKMEKGESG